VALVPVSDLPARRYGCVWHASQGDEPRVAALRAALRSYLP